MFIKEGLFKTEQAFFALAGIIKLLIHHINLAFFNIVKLSI